MVPMLGASPSDGYKKSLNSGNAFSGTHPKYPSDWLSYDAMASKPAVSMRPLNSSGGVPLYLSKTIKAISV